MPLSPHRLARTGILAIVCGLLLAVPAVVSAQSAPAAPTHPIVATAAQYEGQYGGQCWIFVKNVLKEALGIDLGRDYRLGFLEAGGVEIAVEFAQPGDIIQIADDNYTEPHADYPGLHTFIISEVVDHGVYNGWDSNSQWDEIVRYRENYDARAVAGRYPNLNFRIYRFPTPDNPVIDPEAVAPPQAKSRQLAVGDTAVVVAGGDTLNLRAGAGLDQGVIARLPDGTVVSITGGPVRADGHTWVSVTSPSGSGWVASEYLAYRDPTSTEGAGSDGAARPLFSYRTTVASVSTGD